MMVGRNQRPDGPPVAGRGPLFEFDASSLLFNCTPVRCYDVSSDGQRFYVTRCGPPRPVRPSRTSTSS